MDKPVIEVRPETYIYAAVLLLILPIHWVLSAFIAGAIHECCHYMALRLCGGKLWRVKVGITGTIMDTEPLPPKKELLCTLAGPVGSLALIFLIRSMPLLAVCGFVQGVFNLFPMFPMDGGRIVRCAMMLLVPKRGEKIAKWIESGFVIVLIAACFYAFIYYNLGILAWVFLTILLYRVVKRKIPCKESVMRVQ